MIKKKVVAMVLTLSLTMLTLLVGCTKEAVEDNTKKVGDSLKNGAENVGDTVKEGAEGIGEASKNLLDKITDHSMTYNEDDFEKDLESKGYKLTEVEDSKSLFSVKNDDYTLNGDKISIYEYDENDKDKLEGDLKTITDNGMIINGAKVSWTNAPHFYKKGRIIVVYDGNNESILTALKEILNKPLLG